MSDHCCTIRGHTLSVAARTNLAKVRDGLPLRRDQTRGLEERGLIRYDPILKRYRVEPLALVEFNQLFPAVG